MRNPESFFVFGSFCYVQHHTFYAEAKKCYEVCTILLERNFLLFLLHPTCHHSLWTEWKSTWTYSRTHVPQQSQSRGEKNGSKSAKNRYMIFGEHKVKKASSIRPSFRNIFVCNTYGESSWLVRVCSNIILMICVTTDLWKCKRGFFSFSPFFLLHSCDQNLKFWKYFLVLSLK